MVSIHTENLGLVYRLARRFSLATRDRRIATATGGSLVSRGDRRVVEALHNVTFELEPGDRLALVGANGAGKTSLLKVLYGIFEPTEGSVVLNGRVDALFNINLGFRQEATGRRNIELRGLLNGWSRSEIHDRMNDIIAFSELDGFIDVPLKTYSQGMAARLAFAVATSLDPEILLLDEWIGAGDTSFQKKARRRMREITERAGIIVIASHNKVILQETCNKGLVLDRGRVVFFGSLEEALSVYQWALG